VRLSSDCYVTSTPKAIQANSIKSVLAVVFTQRGQPFRQLYKHVHSLVCPMATSTCPRVISMPLIIDGPSIVGLLVVTSSS
jgi:hypothetical protein